MMALERHLVDVEAIITFDTRVWFARYGTEEYWEKLERQLNDEAKELIEFIRDHRSRDDYQIDIRKVYNARCSHCGWQYDVADPSLVVPDCCDEAIEEYGYELVRIKAQENS